MIITRIFSAGIGCAVFGIAIIIYAVLDYQNRLYEYRYLPSPCKIGSSCPLPAINDGLTWIGITAITIGVVLVLFRKLQFRKDRK